MSLLSFRYGNLQAGSLDRFRILGKGAGELDTKVKGMI